MNIRKFNPANLGIDVNTIGAVLGILAVIAAIVGGVVGSGALNDQSGSSRGASAEVIEVSNDKPAPSQPKAPSEETAGAETGEDYLSPTMRENSKYFEELSRQAQESMRRQREILEEQEKLSDQAEDYLRQAEEAIRLREAAGLY